MKDLTHAVLGAEVESGRGWAGTVSPTSGKASRPTQNRDACHQIEYNLLPELARKAVQLTRDVKSQGVCLSPDLHPSSISVIEEAFPSLSREGESFESALKF